MCAAAPSANSPTTPLRRSWMFLLHPDRQDWGENQAQRRTMLIAGTKVRQQLDSVTPHPHHEIAVTLEEQFSTLASTARALETTAAAAEARYKQVLAANAELADKSNKLEYSLHLANVRIRILEGVRCSSLWLPISADETRQALQAKQDQLERALRAGAPPEPVSYARVYDLEGQPMQL